MGRVLLGEVVKELLRPVLLNGDRTEQALAADRD